MTHDALRTILVIAGWDALELVKALIAARGAGGIQS